MLMCCLLHEPHFGKGRGEFVTIDRENAERFERIGWLTVMAPDETVRLGAQAFDDPSGKATARALASNRQKATLLIEVLLRQAIVTYLKRWIPQQRVEPAGKSWSEISGDVLRTRSRVESDAELQRLAFSACSAPRLSRGY